MSKRHLTNLLRDIAREIDALSDEDWMRFENGELQFKFINKTIKLPRPPKEPSELAAIVQALQNCTSREVGLKLLEPLNKLEIDKIAKSFDVVVKKTERLEEARARLVEAVVGSKLGSQAIRGASN